MKAMFFSGGYDSTYLLNKLMKEEKELMIVSIDTIVVGPTKRDRENLARKRILDYLKAKYYNCHLEENVVKLDLSGARFGNSGGLNQDLFWMPLMMITCRSYEDIELNLSYICNDQSRVHMDDFRDVARAVSHYRDNNIQLRFPLAYKRKYDILEELIMNDKFLFENATACENPGELDFCGSCEKCHEIKSALISIMERRYNIPGLYDYIKDFLKNKFGLTVKIERYKKEEYDLKIDKEEEK